MAFYDRLQEILKERGENKSSLARHLGITSQSVGQWGKSTAPVHARLEEIAKFLQVSVPDLLAPKGTPIPPGRARPHLNKGSAAQFGADGKPRGSKLVKGVEKSVIPNAWESLPKEDQTTLLGVLNALLAKNGKPPVSG